MKRSPLVAAATLTLLATCAALAASQKDAGDVVMPEVKVTGDAADRQHPQDGNFSEPPLGCVEVITPSTGGNISGGFFFAQFAPSSVSVMPSLRDPSSANDTRPDLQGKEHQPIPPGPTNSPRRCP